MKFKFILSDLDGVIRNFPVERDSAIEEKYNLPTGSLHKAAFENPKLDQAIRGLITDEEWRRSILANLAMISDASSARKAFIEWNEFSGLVDYEYLNFLDENFVNLPVVVLTNATKRLKADLAKLDIENWFFRVFNSADIGLCKPEKTIFEHVLRELYCKPSEVLFIDDSLSHVQVAKEMGFQVHHYKSFDGFKHEFQSEDCNEFV